jgi:hypothetical protein
MDNTQSKSSSGGILKFCLAGCLVVLVCSICCAISGAAFMFITYKAAVSQLDKIDYFDKLCNASDSELDSFYNDYFTADYKSKTSLAEFKAFYSKNKDTFSTCDKILSDVSYMDIAKGVQINYNVDSTNGNDNGTLEIVMDYNGKRLDVEFKLENEEWKINNLTLD